MSSKTEPKGFADGVPVYCDFTEIVPTDQVRPNPKNDRFHPPYQIELIGRAISVYGWRAPITISTRSGLVTRGEGRYLAAVDRGWIEVPVDYQHYETETEELADLKADNRIADMAHFDPGKETDLLRELRAAGVDLSVIGYTDDDLSGVLDPINVDQFFEEIPAETLHPKDDRTETCPLCGAEFILSRAKRLKKPRPPKEEIEQVETAQVAPGPEEGEDEQI